MLEHQNPVYYPVREAIRRQSGLVVSRFTAMRWYNGKLKNGRVLEAFKLGGQYVTTLEAVEDFMANHPELTEVSEPVQQPSRSRRQKEKEKALREINELC